MGREMRSEEQSAEEEPEEEEPHLGADRLVEA